NELAAVAYETHPVFGLSMPTTCPNVPDEVLSPRQTRGDAGAYDVKAKELADSFKNNFKKFEEFANEEIMAGAPIQ
ncbi:MAG: phosphoenolpyruvate carboxykinase (ATP), partial [Flavobacteriaceae bacterium]|nr:phosphoenolpyruvate carboxykinase (ATP) [Flavobacteriaceae bacterium]